jgi:hypothetical protein
MTPSLFGRDIVIVFWEKMNMIASLYENENHNSFLKTAEVC